MSSAPVYITDGEPHLLIPEWAWMKLAPVVHAAVALWHNEAGEQLHPVDCFSYLVPVPPPLIVTPRRNAYVWRDVRETMHEWSVAKFSGEQFLPLYRAVAFLLPDYQRDEQVRSLLGMEYPEEEW